MNFVVKPPTITATQSYSLVIRDIFFTAVKQMPFFQGFIARKSKYYQVQPENIPYLGIYIIGEDMIPDGDANAGNIGFIHTLRLGFSVVIQNNDPEISELKMDQAFWAIMNGLWTDQYICSMLDTQAYGHPEGISNPDNVRFEGIPRASRRHMYGDNKLTNEMPYCELQYDVSVIYRTDFVPVITDNLNIIHVESQFGDPPNTVQPVTSVYDFTATQPPIATVLTLTTVKTPTIVNEFAVFMAVVSAIAGGDIPIGTIGFRIDGGALQGIGPPHHTGSIAYPISSLAVGTHSVVAEFIPDSAEYVASVSSTIQHTVI